MSKTLSKRQKAYREYLKTDHWKLLRAKVIERDENCCSICGSNEAIQVHHKTYRTPLTLCTEDDLETLCRAHHRLKHGIGPNPFESRSRFLHPGLTNSNRWNSVSIAAQSMFVRLLTRVDDFGQFSADPLMMLNECWVTWNTLHPEEAVTSQAICTMLVDLMQAGLIELWCAQGRRPYLQITQWRQRIRDDSELKWRESNLDYFKWRLSRDDT